MISRPVVITVLCLFTLVAHAQDRTQYDELVTDANRYFAREQYHLAIELYTDALQFNDAASDVDYHLAQAYRAIFDYAEAEAYFLKVLYTAQDDYPLALYYYASMLKLNGNAAEAMQRFDQFIAMHEQEVAMKDFVEQAIIERAGCEMEQDEATLSYAYPVVPADSPINTPYQDFAPAVPGDGALVITSSRDNSNRSLIDERNGEGFTDNYYFVRTESGWENKTRQFSVANSLYHDGSGSFNRQGDRYFFTICEERCRIFETHRENRRWSRPAPLDESINQPGSDSKHAAVSPGGDTLIFASNRPGSYGGFDIWISRRSVDDSWTMPVNAGKTINTKANEMSPALTTLPNVLFFSSDGHPGYGGYDLFVAKGSSTGDTVLYNCNRPFNSERDDCFATFRKDEMLWSSNRPGGEGGFDIYFAAGLSPLELVSRLSIRNRNDSRGFALRSRTARAENVNLMASRNEETIDYDELTYERKSIVNAMVENRFRHIETRRDDFPNVSDEEYGLLYQISHTRFNALMLKHSYPSTFLAGIDLSAGAGGTLTINGQVFDEDKNAAIASARVLLTNEYGDILKITSTNASGGFRFTEVPAKPGLQLRLEDSSGEKTRASVRNMEMRESHDGNTMYAENVYFDFDHYNIRPEAARVLADLATYLKSNPGAQVEIYAFADDRGSSTYNFELTRKRGEAVASFLTANGVDATSLAIIAKGKQTGQHFATEIQRQFNRRVEFYVNGIQETVAPAARTYILKKDADWSFISQLTGVAAEALKELNDADSETARAFQPIRIPLTAGTLAEDLFFAGI